MNEERNRGSYLNFRLQLSHPGSCRSIYPPSNLFIYATMSRIPLRNGAIPRRQSEEDGEAVLKSPLHSCSRSDNLC